MWSDCNTRRTVRAATPRSFGQSTAAGRSTHRTSRRCVCPASASTSPPTTGPCLRRRGALGSCAPRTGGSSFSQVREAVGLQNGVAAYHLGVLERQGLVRSKTRRRHRWYYPDGDATLWHELPLSPLQSSLLDEVRRRPGVGVRELARHVDRRTSSVAYNVKALARDGVLRTEQKGRKLRCFPADEPSPA